MAGVGELDARERHHRPTGEQRQPISVGLANEDGYPHDGYIDFVDNRVDPGTGTIEVRGVLPNKDGLLYPGLFARIRAPFETEPDAVVVEHNAVSVGLEGPYLLVVDDENMVERRAVELGARQDDGTIRVLEGIDPDERYIVKGLQNARPGKPVRIRAGKNASSGGPARDAKAGG